jgi:hypothetical protein
VRLTACQQDGYLRAITYRPPLTVDLMGEEGAPFAATFNLFDDPRATNLRGLWQPWSEYEEGEVVYVTPEGAESGIRSERTPVAFGAWVALRRTQHSEPGQPQSRMFWAPMQQADLAGKTLVLTVPGREDLTAVAAVSGGNAEASLDAIRTALVPSSVPYRLELHEAGNVSMYVARGQIIFRSSDEPASEPPFVAEAGQTFEETVKVWKDSLHTKPQDLAGWEVRLEIAGVKTLTEGHGLTITGENSVLITLSAAEATEFSPRSARCTMTIRKAEQVVTVFTNRQFLFLP